MDEIAFIQGETSNNTASARNNPLERKKTSPITGSAQTGASTPLSNINSGRQWGNATAGVAAMKQMFALSDNRDQSGAYQSSTSSVRDYSYTEDKNSRFRSTMEDSKNISPSI